MADLERLTVEQWLKSIHFGEYCTKFEEAGYDDLSFLVRLTDAEVNEMQMSVQMTKGGHRLKFTKALADLRSQIETHQERQKEQQTPTRNQLKPKQQSTLKIVNGRFVVSSPENKEKKSPDPWDTYKIPNIHTARMKFYNDITKEIYQSAFAELQLSRFQDYLTQQRTFRWEVNQDISNLEVLLKFDTNDGLALNVHKYQSVPTNPAAADVEKCNLTMKRLSEMEGKVGAALSRLQERKNSLYCPNNVPKKWINKELIFIDQHLKPLDELKRRVCSFNCNVVHTYKMLSGRFSRDTVTAAERSRKRRRNKEQRRKSIKRQKEKGKKQAFKLIRNIYGKEMADQVFSGKLLADTEKLNSRRLGDIKLLPHFHLNALEYLLQIDAMDNKQTVQYYIELLKTRKQMKAVPPKAEDQPPEDQLSESSGDETD